MTDDMDDRPDHEPLDVPRALAGVRAPDALRQAVEQAVTAPRRSRRASARRRLVPALAAGAALLLAALVVVFASGGDGGGPAPRVQDVAGVALRPAAAPAPATLPGGELLDATAGPIAFPTWTRAGWRAVGERTDTVDGHELRTVVYADLADPGQRLGYAIADAELPVAGGRLVEHGDARLRVLTVDGAHVVTWNRAGRTCILAARDVPLGRLVRLASYAA